MVAFKLQHRHQTGPCIRQQTVTGCWLPIEDRQRQHSDGCVCLCLLSCCCNSRLMLQACEPQHLCTQCMRRMHTGTLRIVCMSTCRLPDGGTSCEIVTCLSANHLSKNLYPMPQMTRFTHCSHVSKTRLITMRHHNFAQVWHLGTWVVHMKMMKTRKRLLL
jgi:hypothetical protein